MFLKKKLKSNYYAIYCISKKKFVDISDLFGRIFFEKKIEDAMNFTYKKNAINDMNNLLIKKFPYLKFKVVNVKEYLYIEII